VTVPDADEDALLDWARATFLRPDFVLQDAYQGLVSELLFLGERYGQDEDELNPVGFSLALAED